MSSNLLQHFLWAVLSHFSHVQLFATPWTVAHQAPLFMGFPRQGYWSQLPFPSPGSLSDPGIKSMSLTSPALAGRFFTTSATCLVLSEACFPELYSGLYSYIGERICLQCKRPEFSPWVGKMPWRRKWQPTLVFLPGKFHAQRSLVGYSPWGHKESDMTEQLTQQWEEEYIPFCIYMNIHWIILWRRHLLIIYNYRYVV